MVTVLLTVFNGGEFLPGAIESVLGQTYRDFELLILDDGSTDPLVHEALDGITDPRVSIRCFAPTEQERRATVRYAHLINEGAAQTTGEYVTYLCHDDFYLPDRLERMVGRLHEGPQVVYGAQRLLDGAGRQFGVRDTLGVLTDAFHLVDHNSVMHTRAAFEHVGGWPTSPDLWRDADAFFWRRLTAAGYRFHPVDGGPTDAKRFDHGRNVDDLVIAGKEPWAC